MHSGPISGLWCVRAAASSALGLILIVINRVFGLVLPASTKFLIDTVIGKHQASMLVPLVLAVVGATAIQGVTSFRSPSYSLLKARS